MKPRTLTLRLDDRESERLDAVQKLLGQRTASKTVNQVVRNYPDLIAERDQLRRDLDSAILEVHRLERVINSASLAASELLERCGQRDIFGDHS